MLLPAILLALCGAIAMGASSVIQRRLVKKDCCLFTNSEILLGQNLAALLWAFLALPIFWVVLNNGAALNNRAVFWSAVAIWCLANIGVQSANVKAAQCADVSLTLPYQAMTPGVLTVAVILLGEKPGTLGYFGIALIAIGSYIHGRLGAGSLVAYLIPLWRLLFLPRNYHLLPETEKTKVRDEQRGVRWAGLSAFCGTFGLLSEGIAVRYGNPLTAFVVGTGVLTGVFALNLLIARRSVSRDAVLEPLALRLHKYWHWLVVKGLMQISCVCMPMIANRYAPIAYVGSMKRLSIPSGVFLSQLFLKERVIPGRWATVTIITVGAVLLVVDGTPAKIVDLLDNYLNTK